MLCVRGSRTAKHELDSDFSGAEIENVIGKIKVKIDKRKVERLQERALKVVFNNESVSYDELLRLAELPSLFNRRL